LASKSKIPPQIGSATLQIGEVVGDGVELFGFHDDGVRRRQCAIIRDDPVRGLVSVARGAGREKERAPAGARLRVVARRD
jgi:hypothetical protein